MTNPNVKLRERFEMPRPHKILEKTKTYNLLMTEAQYDTLAKHAHELQKTNREQVAVADLIRDAIDVYISVLEEDNEED